MTALVPLTPPERGTLSDVDRQMLDDAVQAIPSEHAALFTALLLATRAIIAHDVRGIRTIAEGWPELFEQAEQQQGALLEAAHQFQRAATEQYNRLSDLHQQLVSHIVESTAEQGRVRRRLSRDERWGLAGGVFLLFIWIELLFRYGPVAVTGGLLVVVVVVGALVVTGGRL